MIFRHERDKIRFHDLIGPLKVILIEADNWMIKRGKELIVTETWTIEAEDLLLGRVSKSHQEFRATDASDDNLSQLDIIEFKEFMKLKFGHFGAISYSDGKRRIMRYHKNKGSEGYHFHIQIDRKFYSRYLTRNRA